MQHRFGTPAHLAKDIHCIEMVHKFFLRVCAKNYSESYETLLDLFQIPSEQEVIFIIVHFLKIS